jgi:hypothetical protein
VEGTRKSGLGLANDTNIQLRTGLTVPSPQKPLDGRKPWSDD